MGRRKNGKTRKSGSSASSSEVRSVGKKKLGAKGGEGRREPVELHQEVLDAGGFEPRDDRQAVVGSSEGVEGGASGTAIVAATTEAREYRTIEEKQKLLKEWYSLRNGKDGLPAKDAAAKLQVTAASLYSWEKQVKKEVAAPAPKAPHAPKLVQFPIDDDEDKVQVVMVNGSRRHVEGVLQQINNIFGGR